VKATPARVLALLLVVVAGVLWWWWPFDAGARATAAGVAPALPRASDAISRQPRAWDATSRDPFRFADQPTLDRLPMPTPRAPLPPSPLEVRLVGLVRQGGRLRAALRTPAGTFLLGEGESSEGWTVLAIDEDSGVRLRESSGREIALSLPNE
jgi:hypothetical protein